MNDEEFLTLLHEFRDEPVPPLEFRPCLERLLDFQHCKKLDRVFSRDGAKWEKKVALHSTGNLIPQNRGLYMFVWRPEFVFRFDPSPQDERLAWILYVGKAGVDGGTSDTLRDRYIAEYARFVGRDAGILWDRAAPQNRESRLAKYLTLRPLEYWFLVLSGSNDIRVLERKLLRMFRPPLNCHHAGGPRIRPLATVPAFEESK